MIEQTEGLQRLTSVSLERNDRMSSFTNFVIVRKSGPGTLPEPSNRKAMSACSGHSVTEMDLTGNKLSWVKFNILPHIHIMQAKGFWIAMYYLLFVLFVSYSGFGSCHRLWFPVSRSTLGHLNCVCIPYVLLFIIGTFSRAQFTVTFDSRRYWWPKRRPCYL